MRCECCDRILSDREATSKFKGSGMFTSMCTTCVGTLPDDLEVMYRVEDASVENDEEFFFEEDSDGYEENE